MYMPVFLALGDRNLVHEAQVNMASTLYMYMHTSSVHVPLFELCDSQPLSNKFEGKLDVIDSMLSCNGGLDKDADPGATMHG
jgi:hypothetical protein